MRVASVNQGLPFKAKVESSSPLVSGNWAYLENNNKTETPAAAPEKKSHWLRNTIITALAVAAIGYGLIKGRQSESISRVMNAGYENLTTKMDKFKYGIGKLGDYAGAIYNKTIGKVVNYIKGKLPKAAEAAADAAESAAEATV